MRFPNETWTISTTLCGCGTGCCRCFSQRYLLAFLTSAGFVVIFGMRCNIGLATAAMTVTEHEIQSSNCSNHSSLTENINRKACNITTQTNSSDVVWTPDVKSMADASYFWGAIITRMPGGYLASRYPPNRIFGLGVGISAVLNLFLPVAAETSAILLISIRVCQGLAEGVCHPSCQGIWRFWAPPLERSKLVTMVFSGPYIGLVMGTTVSGVLVKQLGWESGFYLFGGFGILWAVLFFTFVFERPSTNRNITPEELKYLEQSIGGPSSRLFDKDVKTPWFSIFTSLPVYAILVAYICRSWTLYILVFAQPMYSKQVFNVSVDKDGLLLALSHMLMALTVPLGGQIADELRKREILSTTKVRKLFNCGGFGMEACLLIGVAFARDLTTAMTCLVLGAGSCGLAFAGFNVNQLDLAPRYVSIIMGISSTVGSLAGIVAPLVTDFFTKQKGSQDEWRNVFLFASGVYFLGVIFYALFASGEQQHWAEPTTEYIYQPEVTLNTSLPTEKTYGSLKECGNISFSDSE